MTWHLKITNVPVIVGDIDMSRKRKMNTLTRYSAFLGYVKSKKCTLQNSSFSQDSTISVIEKMTPPKVYQKSNINTY